MTDLYYAPTKKAHQITLAQLQHRLTVAGLPCGIEEDSADMHWLVFDPHESTLCVSTTSDQVIFATFGFSKNDDMKVAGTIEAVMDAIGFEEAEQA